MKDRIIVYSGKDIIASFAKTEEIISALDYLFTLELIEIDADLNEHFRIIGYKK